MVELHFCLSLHEVFPNFVLSDPFSIAVTNSKAKMHDIRIEHLLSFLVLELNGDVDVPLLVDQGGSLAGQFQSVFVVFLSKHPFNKGLSIDHFFFLEGLSRGEVILLVGPFGGFSLLKERIKFVKGRVESLFVEL